MCKNIFYKINKHKATPWIVLILVISIPVLYNVIYKITPKRYYVSFYSEIRHSRNGTNLSVDFISEKTKYTTSSQIFYKTSEEYNYYKKDKYLVETLEYFPYINRLFTESVIPVGMLSPSEGWKEIPNTITFRPSSSSSFSAAEK